MPIYEYSCARCGKTIEIIQKFSDKPSRTHKDCGGKLTRLISQSAFHLKGSGWYVTDYARKGAPADGGTGDSADTATTKPEAASTEAAPAKETKAEARPGTRKEPRESKKTAPKGSGAE